MTVHIVLLIGLFAGLLMFSGDMLLYYDKNDYVSNGAFDSLIAIMKYVSDKRLYMGGVIGPIAATFYCVGYYHILLITQDKMRLLAYVCFFCCCFAIIIGGAYHSHCAYLGLIGKVQSRKSMNVVIKYFSFINKISMIFQVVGLLILAILIGAGFTIFPRWMVLITPGILYLLLPLWRKLPKGIHIIICGGWTNLIFVIYYLISLIHVL